MTEESTVSSTTKTSTNTTTTTSSDTITELNVLFLGNSYTYYNNLPYLVQKLANSVGLVLNHDQNTPGGAKLKDHVSGTSISKIRQGGWDVVVLQEQSQIPSLSENVVCYWSHSYADQLSNEILASNPNAKIQWYLTWGRINGDSSLCGSYPNVCTYEGIS